MNIDPKDEINNLIKNYNLKNFKEALKNANNLTNFKINNKEISLICGELFLHYKLYKKALFSFAYSIKLDPNFFLAYKYLAVGEYSIGNFQKSLKILEKAKSINDNDTDLYFNIARCYDDLGQYELSIQNYVKSLDIDPNNNNSKINLIKSLTFHKPTTKVKNQIVDIDLELYKLKSPLKKESILDDNDIKSFLTKSFSILKNYNLNLDYEYTQIFRNNVELTDCPRYHAAFNSYNIIPKNCFSCFKVQINVLNVSDLIKLHFLFNDLESVKNIKKCMVEKRNDIEGNYKGFIYCTSTEEAESLKNKLAILIDERLEIKHDTFVKRGCSEFALKYPDYKITNPKSKSFFKYKDEWEEKEKIVNQFYPKNISNELNLQDTLNGNSLNDIIVIQNWIKYAIEKNDNSFKKFI